ncbi:hypothetical protein BKG67_23080 [Mycobacteroides chelonae]|nr:hypothetical protein BKG66_24545 [Mycobacteroides chelonae]OHT69441.1 hypothetical protein BKG67_23080 [Mycobacteroides chelonae]
MIFNASPFTPHTKQWKASYSYETEADLFVSPWKGHSVEVQLPDGFGLGGSQSGKYFRIALTIK